MVLDPVGRGRDIKMVNTEGKIYDFSPSQVFITLGVGWAAFILALIFNIVYYVLHPSQVCLQLLFWISILFQVNVTNIKEKCVVALFGKKIHLSLCCSVTEDLDAKEDKVENPLQKIEMALLNSGHDNLEEVISTDK